MKCRGRTTRSNEENSNIVETTCEKSEKLTKYQTHVTTGYQNKQTDGDLKRDDRPLSKRQLMEKYS